MTIETDDLWVFGYGSLMWKPGFEYTERRRAALPGYVRRFCLDSITYRGTPEFPGLVLALDEEVGGHCDGVAFRVPGLHRKVVHEYLRARELVTYSYLEKFLSVEIEGTDGAQALCYVMDRSHQQYRGGLSIEAQAEVIATAHGPAGSNVEYLLNTIDQLKSIGVDDPDLTRIGALVAEFQAGGG